MRGSQAFSGRYTFRMAAKKPRFITYTKKRMEQSIANFGTLPEGLVALFKNREGREDECLQFSHDFLTLEPKNYAAMLYLATLYEDKKDFKNAVKFYRKVTKGVPMMYLVWLRQGMAEIMLGEIPAARDSLKQYVYFVRGEWFPIGLIAITYLIEGKKEMCFYFLDEMLKTGNIDKPEKIVWLKGYLEEHGGDTEHALIHYVESMLMGGDESDEDKAMTALKIRELAEKKTDDEE